MSNTQALLWDAFRAGFDSSGEGWNGEHPSPLDEDVRPYFDGWYTDLDPLKVRNVPER